MVQLSLNPLNNRLLNCSSVNDQSDHFEYQHKCEFRFWMTYVNSLFHILGCFFPLGNIASYIISKYRMQSWLRKSDEAIQVRIEKLYFTWADCWLKFLRKKINFLFLRFAVHSEGNANQWSSKQNKFRWRTQASRQLNCYEIIICSCICDLWGSRFYWLLF